ncbi:MAG: adenylyltransferase/cytidyltransferase family protein [archaeon]
MKKIVWLNKSNGQLCVTIPKNSGIKDGDIVDIKKENIRKIVYSFVTADLFHYGHLQLLLKANSLGDFHICGVLTNKAIIGYKNAPVANFNERKSIVEALQCVDMVMSQEDIDPTNNLKKIHEQFPNALLTLVHGSDWKTIPGSDFIKKINGTVVTPAFYERLSTEKIIKRITK